MTLLPDLRADLERAADRPRRRLPLALDGRTPIAGGSRDRRTPLLTAGAVVAVLAAGGVATAAVTGWNPQLGDDRRGHPTADPSLPPAEQLDRLAVLRREPSAADRGVEVRNALSYFSPASRGIRTDSVRYLGKAPNGRAVVLVPAVEAHGTRDALCLWVEDTDGGGYTCPDTRALLSGSAVLSITEPRALSAHQRRALRRSQPLKTDAPGHYRRVVVRLGVATTFVLVPDGVAKVQLGNASPVDVYDNLAILPGEVPPPGTVRWLDAAGHPVLHPAA